MSQRHEHLFLDIVVPGLTVVLIAIIALMVVGMTPAKAHCPPGTAYGCIRDYDGKQICGCR